MVETRRLRKAYDDYDEEQLKLAIRMSRVDAGQLKQRKTMQTTIKQSFGKVTKSKASTQKRVVKAESPTEKASSNVQNGKIKLTGIKYQAFPYETMRKWQARGDIGPPKQPPDYWPYPNHPGVKLGHNSWKHLNWKGPSEEEVRHVNEVLDQRHAEFEHKSYVDMPAHAAQPLANIDVCIQTIFAQSTGNKIAIDTHCRLRNAFTYGIEGRRVAGKIPNWHTIMGLQQEELEQFLKSSGFHAVRARAIKEFLDIVYTTNLRRGVPQSENDGNPPGATDFIPGRLSLDFLLVDGNNSTEAILGRLLNLPQIGLKSAMCILAFAMKRECFPVDVHVLRMSKWLGWLPKDCDDPKKAAMFLHACVPGPIMFNLHQAIWIHCANENTRVTDGRDAICLVCGSSPPPKGTDVEKALQNCPLTTMLPPLEKRWRRYKPEVKKEEQIDFAAVGGQPDVSMSNTNDETPSEGKDEISSSEETLVNSDTTLSISTPRKQISQLISREPGKQSLASTKRKARILNFEKLVSIRLEDVPEDRIEEIQEAGFLLWEFRPMDNSFMEEYGKFEKFPRYKWERPDIMDPDVAVTVEYAKEVLAGKRSHKWSVVDAEDIAVAQAIGAINA